MRVDHSAWEEMPSWEEQSEPGPAEADSSVSMVTAQILTNTTGITERCFVK